ncbi:hypothetical protein GDO81_029822 [Engystomops pustulosus]|uniref:Secreted protein n=1 Tax=Engystomops pustulosus TaxID=76066 RepID=A0AAV6YFQ5_ENGPU|nr:hypothetical protein GDO81_029822 [Engystomops pustulosus]
MLSVAVPYCPVSGLWLMPPCLCCITPRDLCVQTSGCYYDKCLNVPSTNCYCAASPRHFYTKYLFLFCILLRFYILCDGS